MKLNGIYYFNKYASAADSIIIITGMPDTALFTLEYGNLIRKHFLSKQASYIFSFLNLPSIEAKEIINCIIMSNNFNQIN